MANEEQPFSVAAIRELLLSAFTPEDLPRFCRDRPIFRPILASFGSRHGLDDMVDEVITYCDTRFLWHELLEAVKQANPRQYNRFVDSLGALAPVPPRLEQAAYLANTMRTYVAQLQERVNRSTDEPLRPYKELFYYELSDRSIFFGREDAIKRFGDLLGGQGKAHRVIVLHGPSGAGKTSLIKAGIVPRLLQNGYVTLYALPYIAASYENPEAVIRKRILDAAPVDQLRLGFSDLSLQGFLRLATAKLDGKMLVIFLDQFEDFFIHLAPEVRACFIDEFAACYDDETLPTKFVISIRKDYFADLHELGEAVPSIFYNQFPLEPMTREQAAGAITGPVAPLGIRYADELVDALLDDLETGGVELPHLQLICSRLYESRRGNTITLAEYEAHGRAEGILGNYLDRFLDQLGPLRTMTEDVLKRAVTTEGTKRVISHAELRTRVKGSEERLDQVLTRLVDGRLLQRVEEGGVIRYELAHDYLAKQLSETESNRLLRQILFADSWRRKLSALLQLTGCELRRRFERIPPRMRSGIAYGGLFLLATLLLVLAGSAMLRMRASWTRIDLPRGDQISAIAHPRGAAGYVYAIGCGPRIGCSLFSSEDEGGTWQVVTAGVSSSMVEHLSLDPFDPSVMWLATNGDGIFASEDGGKTWTPTSVGLGSFVVKKIETDPNTPGLIYAATKAVGSHGGLYRSLDHGQTWHILDTALSPFSISDLSVADSGSVFVAVSGQGVYRCEAYTGSECSRSTEGLEALDIMQVRVSSRDEVVYAGSASSGLFRSYDWGETWQGVNAPQSCIRHIAVDGTGTLFIVTEGTGGSPIWSSRDQGDSWQGAGQGWLYSTVYAILPNPISEDRIYVGTSSGLLTSSDGGASWTHRSMGVTPSTVQDVAVADTPDGLLCVATTAGVVFRSHDRGKSWEITSDGLHAPVIRDLAIDPSNQATLYIGAYRPGLGQSLFVTWDGGNHWTELDVGNDDVRMIAVDPNNSQRLFAAVYGSGIVRSEDGGLTWSQALSAMVDPWTQAVAIAPYSSEVLMAGTSTGVLYHSDNGGYNWQIISTELPSIRSIVIRGPEEHLAHVGTRRGVWTVSNLSGSWSLRSSLLDASIRVLVRDPCNAEGLFAGTDEGDVWWSANGGKHWTEMTSEQVIERVSTLATYSDCTHSVFVGTGSEGLLLLDYQRLWDRIWPLPSQRE